MLFLEKSDFALTDFRIIRSTKGKYFEIDLGNTVSRFVVQKGARGTFEEPLCYSWGTRGTFWDRFC